MRYSFILSMLLLFSASCQHNKAGHEAAALVFDKTKWELKEGRQYPYRKQMINDLLQHYHWPGIPKDSVIQLLGTPDAIEDNTFMLYHYEQKFLFNSFPLSTQSLVIQLDNDSTVKLARTN